MSENGEWQDLKKRLGVFCLWAVSALLDTAFLSLWVYVQYVANEKVIGNLELSGIDKLVLGAFQVLFAVSTLAPVLVYIVKDVMIMILKARMQIREIEESMTNVQDDE